MQNRGFALALCFALTGCAMYQAQPLRPLPSQPTRLSQFSVKTNSLPFPALAAHRFDPSDGLDETEVATLAVANNPGLKLARDDAAIAHAQAFSAGLLPDPQLSAGADLSNSSGEGGTKAFNLGLGYDITTLITHAATSRAAQAEARKTDLALLWQEWQVVAQARLLYVKLIYGRRLLAVLEENRKLFADRYARTAQAQQRGLLTNDAVLPNLTGLQDVEKQLFDLRRQMSQNARDLNSLLGLDVTVAVPLQESAAGAFAANVSASDVLTDLRRRRPDLLALEAGYAAQDERYRAAVLAQFPALNVNLSRARDSSNIYSKSFGLSLSLPFLNGNRGNIAIEKATRQKLFDEYQQRLWASQNEIQGILSQQQLDMAQLARVKAAVADLSARIARSDLAFRANHIDLLLYASARAALLAKQTEQINLDQQVAEQRVALQTLLGVEPQTQLLSGPSSK